jgi:hypothetical protein
VSPVLIVRPLPDARDEELLTLPDAARENPGALLYFLELLHKTLDELRKEAGRRPVQETLCAAVAEMLSDLRPVLAAGDVPQQAWRPRVVESRLFRFLDFAEPDEGDADVVDLHVWAGGALRLFVPRCLVCRKLLTREHKPENVIQVKGDVVRLACLEGHVNDLPIEKLMLWRRADGELVCWTDRREMSPADSDQEFPPAAAVRGDTASFTWEPADLGLEPKRRHLVLSFPGGRISTHSLDDAFYEILLTPDEQVDRLEALPIKARWRTAWRGVENVQRQAGAVSYQRVSLSGVPFRFHRTYVSTRIKLRPDLSLLVYPKPMHAGWKLYRAAVLGEAARLEGYRLLVDGKEGVLPHLQDSAVWPASISLENIAETEGATWDTSGAVACEAGQRLRAGAALNLGVDFGTTNTVVYFKADDRSTALKTLDNAVKLGDFESVAHWVHPPSPQAGRRAWMFPLPPSPGQDDCLIPSALWDSPDLDISCIRWSADAPAAICRPRHGFKWDEQMQDLSAYRKRFLEELLRLTLPAILDRMGARGCAPALRIGFSYPLAFDYKQRRDYALLLGHVQDWLAGSAGLQAQVFTLNESMASLRAFGAFNPGEVFLVADMGGRTLDLALFTNQGRGEEQGKPENVHQIGSLDFGGEAFLRGIARVRRPQARDDQLDDVYWELRDGLTDAARRQSFAADRIFLDRMDRFHTVALEYLRTMAESWRTACGGEERLRILLVGNGWRLRELAQAGADPNRVFDTFFEHRVNGFERATVEYMSPRLRDIDYSKHWVACGALSAAIHSDSRELGGLPFPSKLPAGRNVTIRDQAIGWDGLVGEGGVRLQMHRDVALGSNIDVDLPGGPPLPSAWNEFFSLAMPEDRRYPTEAQLRDLIKLNIGDSFLRKGPLMLIVENHWREELHRL